MNVDTVNNNCPNNPEFGHGYSFWELNSDGKNAIGTCKFCKGKFLRPVTNNIIQNIEMQKIADICLKDFILEDINNNDILLHLTQILQNFYYYLSDENRKLLDTKMCQLIYSSIIDENNKLIINNLIISIRNGNNDNFLDLLEHFIDYNLFNTNTQSKGSYLR